MSAYQWGGISEGESYDCSGFISYVLNAAEDA